MNYLYIVGTIFFTVYGQLVLKWRISGYGALPELFNEKIIFLFKNKELRTKFLFVIFLFVVFRLAANIPIPGIGAENLRKFFDQNQVFGLLNLFTGGALRR